MKTDLLELLEKDKNIIDEYLNSVKISQFIQDIYSLINKVSDKELINNIINQLQKMKNGTQI